MSVSIPSCALGTTATRRPCGVHPVPALPGNADPLGKSPPPTGSAETPLSSSAASGGSSSITCQKYILGIARDRDKKRGCEQKHPVQVRGGHRDISDGTSMIVHPHRRQDRGAFQRTRRVFSVIERVASNASLSTPLTRTVVRYKAVHKENDVCPLRFRLQAT